MAEPRLTPARRKALEWVSEHEPVALFGSGGPSLSFIRNAQRRRAD